MWKLEPVSPSSSLNTQPPNDAMGAHHRMKDSHVSVAKKRRIRSLA